MAAQFFEVTARDLDHTESITDLSALNAEPAGTHGFVRADQGHFVDDRGTRLRFFGVSLRGAACFPEHALADRLARHFKKLGFNAAWLRAFDLGPGLADYSALTPDNLDRLDYFSAALKAQGLYFSLELRAAGSYVGLTSETLARFPRGKVLDRFYAPFLDAQREFARRLLSHENTYSHTAYGAEPALLSVELSDADTLFPNAAGSPDEAPPSFRADLASKYAPWLAERTANGLRAPGPALEEAKGELPTFEASSSVRADYVQFLRETELENVAQLAAFIRKDLALHSMLIDTQANLGGLAGVLREVQVSDFVDVHSDGALSGVAPQFAHPEASALGTLASYRVFGKPFTISEYGSAGSNEYAAETFPLLACLAGFQDWDALFVNGQQALTALPSELVFLSTAANGFRRGLVTPGKSRVELFVPKEPAIIPVTEDALPNLWRANGVPPSAVVMRQLGIRLQEGSGAISASSSLRASRPLGSDTGELLWEPIGAHTRFSSDAPSLKIVCGMLANSALRFGEVSFEFGDFALGFACASLITLDDQPFARSRHLLFSIAGSATERSATLAQYVPVTLALPRDSWRAAALDTSGAILRPVSITSGADSRLSTALQDAALSYSIVR